MPTLVVGMGVQPVAVHGNPAVDENWKRSGHVRGLTRRNADTASPSSSCDQTIRFSIPHRPTTSVGAAPDPHRQDVQLSPRRPSRCQLDRSSKERPSAAVHGRR